MKGTPFKLKQKLSPKASAAKAARDTLAAKTPARKHKKAPATKTSSATKTPSGGFDTKTGKFNFSWNTSSTKTTPKKKKTCLNQGQNTLHQQKKVKLNLKKK